MLSLTQTVIYLLVVLIEALQPTTPMTVDYLQNETPAMVIRVEPIAQSDGDLYLVTATPSVPESSTGGELPVTVRIEQTDLYAHNYLIFAPGVAPAVVDAGPVRRGFAGANLRLGDPEPFDLLIELTAATTSDSGAGTPSASASVGMPLAGPLHLLSRPPYLLVTSPSDAVVLIAR